ncbi:MAG: dipeptidyl-peptidase-4 [Planctomycetota bacterium]|jgi:dipeptidyl-peptidase-4
MFRSNPQASAPRPAYANRLTLLAIVSTVLLLLLAPAAHAQERSERVPLNKANYKQATKFSSSFLSKFTYDSSVRASWIPDSETFWYGFRTSEGRRYWLVDPVAKTKVPLFDHELMAALLSEACKMPIDEEAISLSSVKFDKTGDEMKFSVKGKNFVYTRSSEKLEKKEKPKAEDGDSSEKPPTRGQRGRGRTTSTTKKKVLTAEEQKKATEKREKRLMSEWRSALETYEKKHKKKDEKSEADKEKKDEDEEKVDPRAIARAKRGHRSSFSPNLELYVLARKNNLYVVERAGELQDLAKVKSDKPEAKTASAKGDAKAVEGDLKKKEDKKDVEKKETEHKVTEKKVTKETEEKVSEEKGTEEKKEGDAKEGDAKKLNGDASKEAATKKEEKPAKKADEKEALRFPFAETAAKQLTTDGQKDYTYGGNDEDDWSTPASVTWSLDSSAFYVTRSDSRDVAELFLVNSLSQPRPTLQQYKYSMPGENNVRHSELMMFQRKTGKMVRLKPKWKDESYVDLRWMANGELRVLRRDRMVRNIEYGIADPETGDFKVLFSESLEKAGMATQSLRYLDDRNEMIWWSERSGWGHYYLYDTNGKLKNAITRGRFRASRILDVDEKKGLLWFRGNGREKRENVYYEHLYRVRLDGGDLTLLDEGDASHRSQLSESRKFVVDNCSRTDKSPVSVLRDGEGNLVMELEESDTAQLRQLGWQPPERFVVKAADGTTDLYGNMWKPFDFDENKTYPLIVHVYPGPQTEGVTHTFSATHRLQELAQVGFIVIQVGHRGGTPTRSKAYGSYGYFNMRDYPLEDKKTAIEQLAARHEFIDIDRIGIFGHSGGGFLTATALLKPPYNKFFKVGVSNAGNHDNNIYNNTWSERYHGLKEAKEKDSKAKSTDKKDVEKSSVKITKEKGTDKKNVKEKDTDKKSEKKVEKAVTDAATKKKAGAVADAKQGKKGDEKQGDKKKTKKVNENDAVEKKTKFDIKVATTWELAENLEGKLLIVHGEIDNNVHPAGTMRLVDALMEANKRFDMLIIPGARHSFGKRTEYMKHRTWEYFAEHLLGDRQAGANVSDKSKTHSR